MIDEPLYEAFYGLREQPFSLTTDPRFLYLSAAHRQAFDDLLTGLRRREGLLVLTGETGTGKTTLCRAVIDALGHRTFAALILNPYMTDAEVVRTIVRDFGLVTREDIRRGAFDHADLPQLLDTLEAFLRSLVPLNSYAVVIIDEAQSLSAPVLDQIRMLGSMEVDGRRLLQIVLVGQPGLSDTLASPALRALSDRVSRRDVLDPLPVEDIAPYITHRLAIAGGREAVTFEPGAIQRVAAESHGLPRRINLLCDRALELGKQAGVRTITGALIDRAAQAVAGRAPQTVPPAPEPPAPAPRVVPAVSTPIVVAAPPPPPPPPAPDTLELPPLQLDELERLEPDPEPREPETLAIESELLSNLDLSLPEQAAEPHPRMQLLMDAPPKRDMGWLTFLLVMVLLAALGAGAGYAAFRFGLLRWMGL